MKSRFILGIVVVGLSAFAANWQTGKGSVMSNVSAGDWIDASTPLDMATTPTYPGDTRLKVELLKRFEKGDQVTFPHIL